MASYPGERASIFREETMRDAKNIPNVEITRSIQNGRRQRLNYRPASLRTLSLAAFLVVTIVLIGVLQYAIHELPHGKASDPQPATIPTVRHKFVRLVARNETISPDAPDQTVSTTSSAEIETMTTAGAFVNTLVTVTLEPTSEVSFVLFTPSPSTASPVFSPSSSTSGSTSSSDSLIVSAFSAAETDYVAPETTVTLAATTSVSTTTSSTDTSTTDTALVIGNQVGSEPNVATASTTTAPLATTAQAAYVSTLVTYTLETTYGVDSIVDGETMQMSAPASQYVQTKQTTILITTTPSELLPLVQPTTVISTSYLPATQALPAGDNNNAQPTNQPNASFNTTASVGDSNQSNTNSSSADSAGINLNKVVVAVLRWNASQTFLGTYLPVLLAVLYRVFWAVIFNNSSLIEPFRQLVHSSGTSADRAFFSFYQSQSNLLGPIPALLKRSWGLALAAAAYTVACFLPALASEAVVVDTNWECPEYMRDHASGLKNPCRPRMAANVEILRTLQEMLAFAALALLIMIFLGLRYKTGLPANPSSIATISSLMRHPALVEDLNDVPVNATSDEMKRVLAGKRYRLAYYKAEHGGLEYGIVPLAGEIEASVSHKAGRGRYAPIDGASPFAESGHVSVRRLRLRDLVLATATAGTFGVVLAYYLVGGDNGFNRFFNSGTFGPRFILTGAGTVLSSMWKAVEQSSMIMSPYRRLAQRPSKPSSTILFTPHNTPVSSTLHTLQHGYFFVAALTLITLLAEALNIVISGVPYAPGQVWLQFLLSSYISLAILGLMLVAIIVVIVKRFSEPVVPRKPETLGAVMSYLCGSRMGDNFDGVEGLSEGARDRSIRALGKRYEFKEALRRDGRTGWRVDEYSPRSSY